MNNCLIIFAKYPLPGQVKTRLARTLGNKIAAQIYAEFIRTILERVRRSDVVDHVAFAVGQQELIGAFQQEFPGADGYFAQAQSPDLGVRMREAFAWATERGFCRKVIIGTDSPALPLEWIHEAFHRLQRFEVVLGPAEDGGYYLIGAREVYPALFADIPWSTEEVYRRSLQALIRNGLSYSSLQPYYDIDEEADLRRLAEEAPEIYGRLPLADKSAPVQVG